MFDSTGNLLFTLDNPNPLNNASFGWSVAGAGSNLLVGAPNNTSGGVSFAGQAFLFSSSGELLFTLDKPNPEIENHFGSSVAAVDSNMLSGNPSRGVTQAEQAYLFNLELPTRFNFDDNPLPDPTIAPSTITAITDTGTNVVMQASNDVIVNQPVLTNAGGNGGEFTLQAGRSIFVNANITTDNGNLTLVGNETTSNGVIDANRDPGTAVITVAPGVTLNSGMGNTTITLSTGAGLTNNSSRDITLGNIIARNISVENNGSSSGNINASDGTLSTSSTTDNGGIISVTASGNITTAVLDSSSTATSGNGGPITLTSSQGAITTSNLNSSGVINGGPISLNANTRITAGEIDTRGNFGIAGNVTLDPFSDVQVTSINAEGGTRGGVVDITTSSFFRAIGTFRAANGIGNASISTIGGSRGDSITIRHGGNGVRPFVVGDATTNGTAGAIASGDSTIPTGNSYLYTYRQGNIEIISVPDPSPTPSPTPTPSPSPISTPPVNSVDLVKPQEPLNSLPSPPFNDIDFLKIDNSLTGDFIQQLKLGETARITLPQAQNALQKVENATSIKPALIYAVFVPSTISPAPASNSSRARDSSGIAQSSLLRSLNPSPSDRLELILISARGNPIRRSTKATRAEVLRLVKDFQKKLTARAEHKQFLPLAQTMYQWFVAPLESDLQQQSIQNLAYIMDGGLRSIPLAALHDGKQFLIERYSVGLMPSLSLTDTRYVDVRNTSVLAMGVDKFADQQNPLPSVPLELSIISGQLWSGKSFLNDAFTLSNLKAARNSQPFGILHLATHAEYLPGEPNNSYIQLWDTRLRLDQLRQIGLNKPPVELLVLSACRTAVGDEENELGFAGLAAQAGAKTVLGSLWYVSDEGTLGLMTEFYEQLKQVPMKAEALRRTQLAMLKGEVRLRGGKLITSRGSFPLPPQLARLGDIDLSVPYYWSAFTVIGNPW